MGQQSRETARSSGRSSHRAQILPVIAEIILLVIRLGRKHQTHRAGGEVVDLPPEHGRQMQAIIRTVQLKSFLLLAVIYDHVKTSGHCDQELVTLLQRVSGTIRPAGDVIQIKDPLERERHVPLALEKGQIATGVRNLRQFNDAATVGFHKSVNSVFSTDHADSCLVDAPAPNLESEPPRAGPLAADARSEERRVGKEW